MRAHQRSISYTARSAPRRSTRLPRRTRRGKKKFPPIKRDARQGAEKFFPGNSSRKIIGKSKKNLGFSEKFLLEFPRKVLGPQGSPREREGSRPMARPVATWSRPGAPLARPSRPWCAKAHPSRQGRNLVANFSTPRKKFAFYHIISYVSSFFAKKVLLSKISTTKLFF